MAKAAIIIIAVVAFSAFIAEGQYYSDYVTPDSFYPYIETFFRSNTTTLPQPTTKPLGKINVCDEEGLNTSLGFPHCTSFLIKDHGCHNIPKIDVQWDDKARSVDTHGQCVHLFEHSGCRGQRITIGPSCYSTGCCPHSRFLSKCEFANKMSAFMIC